MRGAGRCRHLFRPLACLYSEDWSNNIMKRRQTLLRGKRLRRPPEEKTP